MKRIRVALTLVALFASMAMSSASAWASPQWCEEDPEFLVNGRVVDVTTFFAGEHASKVKKVHFDMQVPSNATALVLSLPGTVPVTASISKTLPPYYGLLADIPVVVSVTLDTSSSFSTYTQVTGLSTTLVSGTWSWSTYGTKLKFKLAGLGGGGNFGGGLNLGGF